MLALGAEYPEYMAQQFKRAFNETGHPAPSADADEGAVYEHALEFLDLIVDSGDGFPADRLEAETIVWMLNYAAKYGDYDDEEEYDEDDSEGSEPETPQAAWVIRGGRRGQDREAFYLKHGMAGMGWLELSDLRDASSEQDLRDMVRRARPENNDRAVSTHTRQLWKLRTQVRVGDIVVMPRRETSQIALGVVTHGYSYRDDHEPDRRHVVGVDWQRPDVSVEALRKDLRKSLGSQLTIFSIHRNDGVWRLSRLLATGRDPGPRPGHDASETPTLERLAETLLWDVEHLRKIERLLRDKRQVIFQGPPGTGKTYVARKLAACLAGSSQRVRMVQFHPSYAYEDFVQGFRPTLGKKGRHGFTLRDGPLIEAANAAREAAEEIHVLVIDEINRGNLSKVLGELYFLLEYREAQMHLQYSDELFSLPENLWIIGTMNTADRSIAVVDLALRRRFHFVEFHPDKPPVEGLLREWLDAYAHDMSWVADVVDLANEKLSERHAAIGPSYFMRADLDDETVQRIWEHSVLPYIEEQLFGEHARLAEFDLARLRSDNSAGEDSAEDPSAAYLEDEPAADASD